MSWIRSMEKQLLSKRRSRRGYIVKKKMLSSQHGKYPITHVAHHIVHHHDHFSWKHNGCQQQGCQMMDVRSFILIPMIPPLVDMPPFLLRYDTDALGMPPTPSLDLSAAHKSHYWITNS
ncbi:hypothetical protein CEXT_741431 [Caerostris extrusa]|uniref:Uncharacterized protein n=1 Tax=Caerostris extrusa TaxID=172846 RepID=A0AAV4UCE2_CAEEX|nr:hypothetical protein CEXT_741431 [Caerostris extrusa]